MSKPRAVLVHVAPPRDDIGDSAIKLEDRALALKRLAPALGLELDVVEAEAVLRGDRDAAARLAGARALWWAGRTAFLPETTALWRALEAAAPGVPRCDLPEHVDETFDLSRSFPLLERAGVPQPRTRFHPLPPRVVALDEPALRAEVARRLRWTWPWGRRFFRTYYGTRKLHLGALNVAADRRALVDGATDLVLALRGHQAIGGLAVREVVPIDGFWDAGGKQWVTREYRVFVLQGEPVLRMNHVDVTQLRRLLSPEDLRRAGALAPAQRQAMLDHARAAGRALRATLFAIDFAVRTDGAVVCLEVNPGHCSGWGTPAAYVRVHGELLRRLAGLPALSGAESLALAREAGVDLGGHGEVFELL